MCGIAGLFQPKHRRFPAEALRDFAEKMSAVMVHRGPDGSGLWADPDGRCALAHRRLSIIDTSNAAAQPFHSADGRWCLSFNGEIYNYRDIRAKLERQGVRFRSTSDTEVLVEAIALWGIDVIREFDGMFAFAAFDTVSGELVLARDAFGEKPLYFSWLDNGLLAFASELRSLEALDAFDRMINVDAVAECLSFQYIGAPRSIYAKTEKLPPGTLLTISQDGWTERTRYFRFEPATDEFDTRPLALLADELEDILLRSIERRLIADVPLGAFLSGGVDSSTVCALAATKLGVPLQTYSIGFEAAVSESEHDIARAFAKHLGTDHHEEIISPDVGSFLQDFGKTLDEPNADTSCLPTYHLSRFARQQVTVAISGDGGDEMFGGYGRYAHLLAERKRRQARSPWDKRYWHAGSLYYGPSILIANESEVADLLGFLPETYALHLARLRADLDTPAHLLAAMRKTDADHYMPGAVLAKVDRMSMQHSLEVRTPFLNVELARFAERLPESALADGGVSKKVLREVAYRYLPRSLIDMPKRGFGLPMNAWMRDSLLPIAEKLAGSHCMLRDELGGKGLEAFLQRHRDPATFNAYQLWGFVTLELWLRDRPRPVTFPQMPRQARLAIRGATLPQPEIWAVPSRGNAYVAMKGTILQPDDCAPPVSAGARFAMRQYESMAGAACPEPILLTGCSASPYRAPDKRPNGKSALLFPTIEIARRLDRDGYGFLVEEGFETVLLPQEFSPSTYETIGLVTPETRKALRRERLRKDAGVFIRRVRDVVLRRKKKRKIKHKKPIFLREFPQIAPMSPEDWFPVFASRYVMPAREEVALRAGDRIVVFTHGLAPGGAERQWVYLAKGLQQLGYEVTFVISSSLEGHSAHYMALLEKAGVKLISAVGQPLDAASCEFLQEFPAGFISAQSIAEVAAVFRAIDPKVVFAQLDSSNITAGIASLVADVPRLVMSFRNYNPTHFSQWAKHWGWMYQGYRMLLGSDRMRWTGNFEAANNDYADWLGLDRARVATIPNAIDEALFPQATDGQVAELRRELGITDRAAVVLGTFRLDKEKCPGDFIAICGCIAGHDSDTQFVIAGIGPLEPELRAQASKAGIAHRMHFLGARSDVNVLMRTASLLLHTARFEGMPNVIVEAMVSGTPIVATSVGAIPDLICHKDIGYLHAVGDVAGLASSCMEILKDPEAARKRIVATSVRRHSPPEEMALKYADVASGRFDQNANRSRKEPKPSPERSEPTSLVVELSQ